MVVNRQRRIPVALDPLQRFADRARRELRFADDAVTVCLVSDAAIARLNRRYRGKRGPTDVLSFPSSAKPARTSSPDSSRGTLAARLAINLRKVAASAEPNRAIRSGQSAPRSKDFRKGTASAVPNVAIRRGALAPEAEGASDSAISKIHSHYAGDIAISPSAARRNARRLDRSLPDELRVLILHGMLHLAGYDHETDRGEMDRIERRLRRRLGLG
jgi:rRNA maturation RNase YbeY